MADNRWQIGIAGNYTSADDELVRNAILATQRQMGCSGSEAAKWLIIRANALLQDADPIQELTANAPADFGPVIDAINTGFAMLASKLDNISVVHAPAESQPEETPTEAEDRLLSAGMSEAALVALKTRVFKPGMRLQD